MLSYALFSSKCGRLKVEGYNTEEGESFIENFHFFICAIQIFLLCTSVFKSPYNDDEFLFKAGGISDWGGTRERGFRVQDIDEGAEGQAAVPCLPHHSQRGTSALLPQRPPRLQWLPQGNDREGAEKLPHMQGVNGRGEESAGESVG